MPLEPPSLGATLARLKIERSEADVWVEGRYDAIIYRFVLRAFGIERASVRKIDELSIPQSIVFPSDDEPGVREQLITLAAECEREFGDSLPNLVCVVDRDRDVLIPTKIDYGPYVIATTGASFETLLWDMRALRNVVGVYLGIDGLDVDNLVESLSSILEDLFLLKAAQHNLRLGCRLESARRDVEVSRHMEPAFDRDRYVRRLLIAGGAVSHLDRLEEEVERLRRTRSSGVVPVCDGHHFLDLLGHALQPHAPAKQQVYLREESLCRALATSVDWTVKAREDPMLTELLERLKGFR